MKSKSLLLRVGLGAFLALLFLGIGAGVWLRSSPYWAGITLFSEANRVTNFRTMEEVFPYRRVAAGESSWAFAQALRPLPQTYLYEGETRATDTFLEKTVTTGLIVVHDGAITHEEYRLGATQESRFTSWSLAKSVLSALIGIAVEEGHITSLKDPLDRYAAGLAGSGYAGVTIEQALTMSSGVRFDEDYDSFKSDVNRLFFALGAGTPMVEILADLERERAPGTYNNYISSDSIALGLVLEAATGVSAETYLESRLWKPMGAEAGAIWNTGRAGPVLPFCCFNATLRDYARFGRLHLDGGARDGIQIVPYDWVVNATRPTAPHLEPGQNPASFWTFGYGYHWWIPEDQREEFLAIGIWGQYIYVDRARGVVIVKTSVDPDFETRDHESVAVFRAIARAVDL